MTDHTADAQATILAARDVLAEIQGRTTTTAVTLARVYTLLLVVLAAATTLLLGVIAAGWWLLRAAWRGVTGAVGAWRHRGASQAHHAPVRAPRAHTATPDYEEAA